MPTKKPHFNRPLIDENALAVVAGGNVTTVVTANAAATGCRVDYPISSHWDGGYTSDAAFGISA